MQRPNRTIARISRLFAVALVAALALVVVPDADAEGELPPVLRTVTPDGVEEFEAILLCEISPHGHDVEIRFQWGKTKHYNHLTDFAEQNPYPYSQHQEYDEWIDGLKPDTTYHYRAVASYEGKKIYGKDVTFKTKGPVAEARVHLKAGEAASASSKPRIIDPVWGTSLPELTYGTSVALAPDGVPWFGVENSSGPLLVSIEEDQLSLDYLHGEKRESPISTTSELRFDAEGNLWFVKRHGRGAETIVRRALDGSLTEFSVPADDWVNSLAVGPGGEAWFAIGGKQRQFGFITPAGAITRIPLPAAVLPWSLVAGPEGAIWFIGAHTDIGRITSDGAVRLFSLGARVVPRELVVGSDGALWFSENGRRGRDGVRTARIGRVTTRGKVTQFAIPFGHRTEKLAATPQGQIWFSTDEGELSSISTSGAIGPHGCIHFSCRKPIVALAAGPDGSVWFASAHVFESCGECGGGAQLMLDNMGAPVGHISARR